MKEQSMGDIEATKLSWIRKTWQELKALGPTFFPVIRPPKIAHPGAVHGPRIMGKARFRKTGHFQRSTVPLSNHERVIYGRARKMGISVQEYRRRFGG